MDELRAGDAQEGCRGLVCDRLSEESLSGAGLSIQDHALGRPDADVLVQLRVGEGQLDRLLDLLDLRLQAPDVRVRLEGRLVDLHDRDHGVRVVLEYANDAHRLVVQED